jgi:hypothetical protein
MKLLARIGMAFVVLAGVAVLPLVAANPAMAATCSGYGCDYQDPVATGCASGSYTVSSAAVSRNGVQYGTVDLRWSPTCQTNWSRVWVGAGGSNPNHYERYVWVERQSPSAYVGFDYYGDGSPVYGWMLYVPGCAKAGASLQIGPGTYALGIAYQPGCIF